MRQSLASVKRGAKRRGIDSNNTSSEELRLPQSDCAARSLSRASTGEEKSEYESTDHRDKKQKSSQPTSNKAGRESNSRPAADSSEPASNLASVHPIHSPVSASPIHAPRPSKSDQIQKHLYKCEEIPWSNIEIVHPLDTSSGGFGVVKKGIYKVGDKFIEVAVKELHKELCTNERTFLKFVKEIKTQQELNGSEQMVWVYGYSLRKNGSVDELRLISEWMPHKSIPKYLAEHRDVSLRQRVTWCLQAAKGIKHLHEQKIVHADIKPDNMLLDQDLAVRLSDFGLVKLDESDISFPTSKQNGLEGTRPFMAQSLLEGAKHTEQSDIYALGVSIWCICSDLHTAKLIDGRQRAIPGHFPLRLHDIIQAAWHTDEKKRITATDVAKGLQWLLNGYLDDNLTQRNCEVVDVFPASIDRWKSGHSSQRKGAIPESIYGTHSVVKTVTLKKLFAKFVKQLSEESRQMFQARVPFELANYYLTIGHAMSIDQIEDNLTNGIYDAAPEWFVHEVTLIFQNCLDYHQDEPQSKCFQLAEACLDQWITFLDTQPELSSIHEKLSLGQSIVSSHHPIQFRSCRAKCFELLNHLQKLDTKEWFRTDPRGFTNYKRTITNPMWFDEISRNMHQYHTSNEFLSDLELIWKNCFQFNGNAKGGDPSEMAARLRVSCWKMLAEDRVLRERI